MTAAALSVLIVAPVPTTVAAAAPAGDAVTGSFDEPVDPLRKADADGMMLNRIAAAWTWSTGSPAVTVAVLDTGVSPVADLDDGRLLPGRDVVNDNADTTDDQGHGTYVAATIAGEADNNFGGAGVCWTCKILPVKVFKPTSAGGTAASADVAAGIIWAADHGADIIDVEFAGLAGTPALRDAVAHATAAGALIIAPAGNRKNTAAAYPASIEPVLAVGGTDAKGKPLANATTNPATDPWIDLTANGSRYGINHLGERVHYTSSDAATPLVAGTAALLLSLQPDATAAQVRAALLDGSVTPAAGWGGARQLDAGKATKTFGPVDTVAPVVTDTGVPLDGTVLWARHQVFSPTVVDDRDIVRLELVINEKVVATAIGSPTSLGWTPAGLDGPVDVTVRAYDSSGNVGASTVTVEFDTTNPTLTFLSPENYAAVDGLTTITVDGSADLASLDFLGSKIDATVHPGPWTTTYDFSNLPPGYFTFTVNMRDRAGNLGGLYEWVWIDHDIPVVQLHDAEFLKILHGPIDFYVDAKDTSLTNIDLIIDGQVVSSSGFNRRSLSWPGAEKLTGTFVLTFQATDEAGHVSEAVTRTVRVDNTPPKIAAVTPANNALVRGTFTATASGVTDTSGITEIELWVNGEFAARDISAPYRFPVKTGTRNGALNLEWIAYDAVGNTTSVHRRLKADNRAPTVSITKAPKNKAKVKGKVTVRAAAKDASGIARVVLLVNGKVVATDKTAPYALTVNTAKLAKKMKVQVRAYDKVGNLAATATRTWYRS